MLFGNRTNNGQTQACAMLCARLTLAAAIELFKETRQVASWDTNACIGNPENQSACNGMNANRDRASLRSVLDGIIDKVVESLVQQGRIRLDGIRHVAGQL